MDIYSCLNVITVVALSLSTIIKPNTSAPQPSPNRFGVYGAVSKFVSSCYCYWWEYTHIHGPASSGKATANCGSQWNNSMLSMLQSQLVMTLLHIHFLFGNFSFSLWLLQRNRIQEQLSTATTIYDRPLNKHSNGSPNFDVRNIHQEPISPLKLIINRSMTITLPLD